MRSPRPQNRKPTGAASRIAERKIAQHLATTPHELAVTRFEQGLICAAAGATAIVRSALASDSGSEDEAPASAVSIAARSPDSSR